MVASFLLSFVAPYLFFSYSELSINRRKNFSLVLFLWAYFGFSAIHAKTALMSTLKRAAKYSCWNSRYIINFNCTNSHFIRRFFYIIFWRQPSSLCNDFTRNFWKFYIIVIGDISNYYCCYRRVSVEYFTDF